MADVKLTHKQRLFVEAFLGPANGNATEAARRAGYKGNVHTLKQVAAENLAKPYIADLIAERVEKAVITADEILREMRNIFYDQSQKTSDRLKAGELLGKNLAMWTDVSKHEGGIRIEVEYVNSLDDDGEE